MASPGRWSLWLCSLSLLCIHCGAGAKIRSDPDFSGASLESGVLVVLPIAVTDDLGDERTGIVLDHQSREQATKRACESARKLRDDVKVVCFDDPALANSASLLNELLLAYARDRAVPADRWHELEKQTGAKFVLLFRPESVSASQRVSKHGSNAHIVMMPMSSFAPLPLLVPAPLPVAPAPEGMGPSVDSVKTSRSYTLSSVLVDLHAAKIVRSGVQSDEESTSTTEAPDTSEQLYGIMRDLVEGLLER